MAIANLVCRGFGPAASIANVVTAGYISGATPVTPTNLYYTPHFIEYVSRIN